MKKKMITVALCLAMFFGSAVGAAESSGDFHKNAAMVCSGLLMGGYALNRAYNYVMSTVTVDSPSFLRKLRLQPYKKYDHYTNGYTKLHAAVRNGDVVAVRLLLEGGADVNAVKVGAPLHYALRLKDQKIKKRIVKILLDAGADVNIKVEYHKFVLFEAIESGNEEIVKMLIDAGANVNIKSRLGATPLDEALWKRDLEVYKLLLSAGAALPVYFKCFHVLQLCSFQNLNVNSFNDSNLFQKAIKNKEKAFGELGYFFEKGMKYCSKEDLTRYGFTKKDQDCIFEEHCKAVQAPVANLLEEEENVAFDLIPIIFSWAYDEKIGTRAGRKLLKENMKKKRAQSAEDEIGGPC